MKTNVISLSDSKGKVTQYQAVVSGTDLPIAYKIDTDPEVIRQLEWARINRVRVQLHYGDTETGRDWNEEHDTIGYVGLSRGTFALFPILVYNNRSLGGGAILDNRIVRIDTVAGKKTIYKAKNYVYPNIEVKADGDSYEVWIDNTKYALEMTLKQAERLMNKLK